MNAEGQIIMRLTGVDVPEKVNTESVEVCALCGSITVAGIYDMYDPAAVDFVSDEEKKDMFAGESTQFILDMNDMEHGDMDDDDL